MVFLAEILLEIHGCWGELFSGFVHEERCSAHRLRSAIEPCVAGEPEFHELSTWQIRRVALSAVGLSL